ncbi:MAG: deoxyribonuclease IV [Actinobacteria bacterium]|nr:deoxyribonuclease IV [Actinomycetota bacterium]
MADGRKKTGTSTSAASAGKAGSGGKRTRRLLGIHIRTASGLVTGARHAHEIGCTTFQIMSGNPSAWNPGELDKEQAAEFAAYLDENAMRPVFLHAGYLINLSCRTGRNAPLYAKSVKLLNKTIERAAALSCEYVVVHLGSRRGTGADEALASLVDGLGRLDREDSGPVLLLENSAGAGDTVGSTFEELALVLAAAEKRGVRLPLGICLDTAHMWGAGYDMTSGAAARRTVDEFDRLVGVERLHLIHLNDSPLELGARRDKHEHLGCGLIPPKGLEAIVRHPRLRSVAMIMETPGSTEPSDQKRMDDLRVLAGI